ncbi:hypothetical protein GDO78_016378 [Eleutherodactylus coqui]|uniref:Uncharacterized protein n=1 Tax=Eleutherodactylus coqui TaxID=57060 RepID=A0A8J6E8B9_ELECQ|nr:hypothetical protein GDO78_016378 [Eleutherodactylus coqui]
MHFNSLPPSRILLRAVWKALVGSSLSVAYVDPSLRRSIHIWIYLLLSNTTTLPPLSDCLITKLSFLSRSLRADFSSLVIFRALLCSGLIFFRSLSTNFSNKSNSGQLMAGGLVLLRSLQSVLARGIVISSSRLWRILTAGISDLSMPRSLANFSS